MLPDKHGLEICRELRAHSTLPILMLTAMGEETDRIVGLEVGADDYLSKPFNPRELLARVRAVLRRSRADARAEGNALRRRLRFAGWELDLGHRRLTSPEGLIIELTTSEYELLVAFADHPQQVLSRNQLMEFARGRDQTARFDRSIDVQVSRLRRKIEEGSEAGLILTVRGDGYMFTPEVEAA
jgi:two-component system OmpR family response regulator